MIKSIDIESSWYYVIFTFFLKSSDIIYPVRKLYSYLSLLPHISAGYTFYDTSLSFYCTNPTSFRFPFLASFAILPGRLGWFVRPWLQVISDCSQLFSFNITIRIFLCWPRIHRSLIFACDLLFAYSQCAADPRTFSIGQMNKSRLQW